MSDVVVSPAAINDYSAGRVVGKTTPTYLVSLEDGKKVKLFISTKFDETNNYGKFVGFYSNATEEKIVANYNEIVASTDKASFIEISFPWDKVISVRSLLYKQK